MERIPYQNGTAPANDAKYTLLLNSFKRHDLLKQSIEHYAHCPGLDAIHVVWCEDQVCCHSNSRLGQEVKLADPCCRLTAACTFDTKDGKVLL
jgi:Glycosyl transferase family 64 domain